MTVGKDAGQLQDGLFSASEYQGSAEPVLMALNPEFYELIWRGLKRHEFRRRFLEGRMVRWFVYLNAPVSRLAAVVDLGPAIVGVPERVAANRRGSAAGERRERAGVCPGSGSGVRDPDPRRHGVSGRAIGRAAG